MQLVVVERRFPNPIEIESIEAIEEAGAWCLQAHRVSFVKTYFARDHKRMLCFYEAPDAESVREAERKVQSPFERTWACERIDGDSAVLASEERDLLVVERRFTAPLSMQDVRRMETESGWGLETNAATHLESYLSLDGCSMICVVLAPDAESLRRIGRKLEISDEMIWSATLHQVTG